MRPWTTRTLQAAVVAAGFAAVGTVSASAADSPRIPIPDLSKGPNDLGIEAPVDTCAVSAELKHGLEGAPCADSAFKVSVPNMAKKTGSGLTKSRGPLGELREGEPLLDPGRASRVVGSVVPHRNQLNQLTKTRPTVGARVTPSYPGTLDSASAEGAVLDTTIGPYTSGQQGMSAGDTSFDITAVQGYQAAPLARPTEMVAPIVDRNPLQRLNEPLSVPKAGDVAPVAKQLPAVGSVATTLPGLAS